jgi:hypothetical protein
MGAGTAPPRAILPGRGPEEEIDAGAERRYGPRVPRPLVAAVLALTALAAVAGAFHVHPHASVPVLAGLVWSADDPGGDPVPCPGCRLAQQASAPAVSGACAQAPDVCASPASVADLETPRAAAPPTASPRAPPSAPSSPASGC